MKVIIYDMAQQYEAVIREKYVRDGEEAVLIGDDGSIKNCIGCFRCWLKTPGRCVLNDHYSKMGEIIGHADEIVILSECIYGTYSPFVRNVLDRTLSTIHPDFTYSRNHEMHHKLRYHNNPKYHVLFYGACTEAEKQTAQKVVAANALNFGGESERVEFYEDMEELIS